MLRFSAVVLLFWAVLGVIVRVDASPHPTGVILVLAPDLSLARAKTMPTVASLLESGSSALMSSRVGRAATISGSVTTADPLTSGYLTISCGSRTAGGAESGAVLNVNEGLSIKSSVSLRSAGRIWAEYHGAKVPDSGLVVPLFQITRHLSDAARYSVPLGAFAEHLRLSKITADVIGNADIPNTYHREAALFVIDSQGRATTGHVSGVFAVKDARYAFGCKADLVAIKHALDEAIKSSRFIVIETGDPARFMRYTSDAIPAAKTSMELLAYRSADDIVLAARKALPDGFRLVVASPGHMADPDAPDANDLQLVISYQKGQCSGLLYSGATHRSGAVANTDIATALTNWLGEPIVIGSGSKLEDRPENDPVGRLHLLEAQARYQSQSQAIVYVLVYASFAAIALAGFSVFAGKRRGYLALACLPPTFFAALLAVTPLYLPPAVLGVACVAAGLTVAMVYAMWSRFRCEYLAAVAVAVGLAAFVFQWYQSAAASYQIAGGARYFGIGNEYSGFFQGAFLCLAASPLLGFARWGRWLGLVCVLVLAGAVGHPSVGANAGDMLGGLIGFIAVAIVLLGKRGKRWALPGLAVALLLLAALGALDASRPAESQSHIGRAVGEIASGGTSAAVAIILRKLELNMMLVRNSPWSLLLAAECTGTISLLIALKRKGAKTDIAQIQGLVALVVALFILNDSGTLSGAAAGMWMFLAVSQQYSFANNAIQAK